MTPEFEKEIRGELKGINVKLDTYIKHQQEICILYRKPLEEHVKDGPHFRDKIVKIIESLRINWVLTLGMVMSCMAGFWWLLRLKK